MARARSAVSLAVAVCILALGALLLGACAGKTPLEQLEESRSLYKATFNGFFVQQVPLVEEETMAEEGVEGAGDEAAAATTEGEAEEPIAVPTRTDVTIDIIVQHDAYVPLDGVTVDITMVDDRQNEVARWLRWIDTQGLPKANQKPVSMVLEDVPYQEGYGFHAEVRRPIPPAERGDYREYEGL